ncbi:MAG TPA: translation initiation factor IF-1 [Solibacterales bacterium]|nr:translation initiation factor IF-1 [Bryobacterales bacterium]
MDESAVGGPRSRRAPREVEAVVLELLPNAAVRVELAESREQVVAHAAAATAANFLRLRPRDRVLVSLSPHDRRRGRIVRLLDERN